MSIRARAFLVILILAVGVSSTRAETHGVGRQFLPPDHWSYVALARFEALRLVDLPSERPYTRNDVVVYVETIVTRVAERDVTLSSRDRFELDRLEAEFTSSTARTNPRERWDPAILYAEEDVFALEGDINAALIPRQAPFDKEIDVFVGSDPEIRFHIGPYVTYDVRYRLLFGPEKDGRARDEKPTPRTKSFKGLTALYDRAYLVFQWRKAVLFWGRDYVDWGPSLDGNLLVSETAESFDKVGGRLDFKNLRMSVFQSKMNGEYDRYLAGHRLEVALWDFVFGLAETVVYNGRGFDPLYMLPFSWYYANQFSERDDDNVLWSFDAKYRAPWGLMLWSSLLIDDAQFERDGNAPDKIGVDVGGRLATTGRIPLTLESQYRYVDIYTYTQRDSLRYYVTGTAMPLEGDPPIGVAQGPDADSFFARVGFFPWPSVTATLAFSLIRRGEGNDWRRHTPTDDPYPAFPSGVVERTTGYTVGGLWELPRNSSASFDVTSIHVANRAHIQNEDETTLSFRVRLLWDF